MVEKSAEAILAFAADRARKAWDDDQRPYLLSRLSPDLVSAGVDYKEVLGDQKLKDFVRTAPNQVKVVAHPAQKSKIGLIPPDKEYVYAAEDAQEEARPPATFARSERSAASRRRYIVSNFLQLLSELDDAEAAQVQIPTNILTKLMRDR